LATEIRKLWCSTVDRGNLNSIVHTLLIMKGALQQWSKREFGDATEDINKLRKELEHVKARAPANIMEIRNIADRMDEVLYREEMMWLQHSRISWLKEGDCNTRFFHIQAKWRSRKNKIKKLKRADGTWCDAPCEMKSMARDLLHGHVYGRLLGVPSPSSLSS
jgi:hypothetical protein